MTDGGIVDTHELAPGLWRVETVEDDKLHGYHVLDGATGPVIVDPGYVDAPTEVYEPFLAEHGWALSDVSTAVVTHSDADHFGGNHELREHAPGVTIAGHVADVPLMESVDRIMDERYSQFEADHGITYGPDVTDWLTSMMGPDEPVDLRLRGGESIRVRDRQLTLLHTPGHTRGHLILYDRTHGVVIGGDAFFGRGLFDVDGNYLQPPPYFLYPAYETTVELVGSLDPSVLSFTHYDVLRDDEVGAFVEESLDFAHEFESLARSLAEEHGPLTLREAIDRVVDRRGSFGLDQDLAFPLTAHFGDLVDRGVLAVTRVDDRVAWEPADA
jgi:glyoxylase-like metal-dependent hydrolase (beta-lactamase superfamily II)